MKKMVIPIIAVFCILSIGIAKIHYQTRRSEIWNLLQSDPPQELYLYPTERGSNHGEIVFTERIAIEHFHFTIKNKTASRQFAQWPDRDQIVLMMDYEYKGNTVCVDTDGRVFVSEDAAELRNLSRLHWLWWKTVYRSSPNIIYTTHPDPKVLEAAKGISGKLVKDKAFDENVFAFGNYLCVTGNMFVRGDDIDWVKHTQWRPGKKLGIVVKNPSSYEEINKLLRRFGHPVSISNYNSESILPLGTEIYWVKSNNNYPMQYHLYSGTILLAKVGNSYIPYRVYYTSNKTN